MQQDLIKGCSERITSIALHLEFQAWHRLKTDVITIVQRMKEQGHLRALTFLIMHRWP